MSAAATAAGYLYASGRLRGRNGRDSEPHDSDHHRDHDRHYGRSPEQQAPEVKRPRVKVAVYQPQAPQPEAGVPKKTPKIQYRTRRWRPE